MIERKKVRLTPKTRRIYREVEIKSVANEYDLYAGNIFIIRVTPKDMSMTCKRNHTKDVTQK